MELEECGQLTARELERIDRLVTPGSPETRAARYWRGAYEIALADLADGNHAEGLKDELHQLVADPKALPTTDETVDQLVAVGDSLERVETAPKRMQVAWHGAWALRLFLESKDRAAVLRELRELPWPVKNQVLTRWTWMNKEHEVVVPHKNFDPVVDLPFQCRVPAEGRPGHNLGREFDTLLCFLPRFRDATGEELLVREKRERPDFDMESAFGSRIGVEVTDAPIKVGNLPDLYAEWRAQSGLEGRLQPILEQRGESIEFEDSESWTKRLEVVDEICERLGEALPAPTRIEIESNEGRISAELSPSSNPRVESDGWGDVTRDLVESVMARILEKLERPMPEIRPCMLIVYPVYLSRVDTSAVARALRGQVSSERLSTHFDEVWLCNEDFAERL